MHVKTKVFLHSTFTTLGGDQYITQERTDGNETYSLRAHFFTQIKYLL